MGKIREGDLFKIIKILDHTFEIKYGYYEEKDKYSKYGEPIPIFPDFIINPKYTKDGHPFVTHMQDKCKHFKGNNKYESCYKCLYYKECEDLIGICLNELNKKVEE